MKLSRWVHVSLILALSFLFWFSSVAADESVEDMLEVARKQFYAAIEDKRQIEPAIALFKQIEEAEPEYVGRTQVYIGALVALKGKHAFFPHTKFRWAKRGLAIMDRGLQESPVDIEALFIHGVSCYYLPFFFQRGDDAQQDFKEIVKHMPMQIHTYHPKLVKNIVVFLLANAKLTHGEKAYLQTVKHNLASHRSVVHQ